MNKYFGVIFRAKEEDKGEVFIVSQDLIKRGAIDEYFIIQNKAIIKLTDESTITDWIKYSDDKKLYVSNNNKLECIDINDIVFEDYIKIYNKKEDEIGFFIVDKYITNNGQRNSFFFSEKVNNIDNKTYCEYYDRSSQKYVYTERVFGLDRIITDEKLENKIKNIFNKQKKENL